MKHIALIVLLLFSAALFGCSRNVPMGGTVTFSDDGSPVPTGQVVFSTPKFIARGMINPDGTYTIGSSGVADGLPRDTYSVTLLGVDEVTYVPGPNGTQIENHRPLIDPKYKDEAASGLTFTVDGKNRTFDIKVDRAVQQRRRR